MKIQMTQMMTTKNPFNFTFQDRILFSRKQRIPASDFIVFGKFENIRTDMH